MKENPSIFVFVPPLLSIGVFAVSTPNERIWPLGVMFVVAVIGTYLLQRKCRLQTKHNEPRQTARNLIKTLSETIRGHLESIQRRAIAKRFNNQYTYRKQYIESKEKLPGTACGSTVPRRGYAWMCPDCNKIHHPTRSSVMSGLQYPACCTTAEGHRLDCGIR